MNITKKAPMLLVATVLFASNAYAQGSKLIDPNAAGIEGTSKLSLGRGITGMLNYFLGILGLIAVAFLIYAGVLMVTAGGNEEHVAKAKKIITYAAVGLIIVILSFAIVQFVAGVLG